MMDQEDRIRALENELSEREKDANLAASIGQELLKQVESLKLQLENRQHPNDLAMNESSPLLRRQQQRTRVRNASDDYLIKELQEQVQTLSEENQTLFKSVHSLKANLSHNVSAANKDYDNIIWELEIRNQELLEEIGIMKSTSRRDPPPPHHVQRCDSPVISHVSMAVNTENVVLFNDVQQNEEENAAIQKSLMESVESLKTENFQLSSQCQQLKAEVNEHKSLLEQAQSTIESMTNTPCNNSIEHLPNDTEIPASSDLQNEMFAAVSINVSTSFSDETGIKWDQRDIEWPEVKTKFDITDKIQIEILSGIWVRKEYLNQSIFGGSRKSKRRFCWINPWKSTMFISHKNPTISRCKVKSIRIETWRANSQDFSIEINDDDLRIVALNRVEHEAFIEVLSKLVDA